MLHPNLGLSPDLAPSSCTPKNLSYLVFTNHRNGNVKSSLLAKRLWSLVPLALNVMAQPCGRVLGLPPDLRTYCLFDWVTIIVRVPIFPRMEYHYIMFQRRLPIPGSMASTGTKRALNSRKVNVYSVALLHSRDFTSSNQVVRLERGTIHEGLGSHVFDFI